MSVPNLVAGFFRASNQTSSNLFPNYQSMGRNAIRQQMNVGSSLRQVGVEEEMPPLSDPQTMTNNQQPANMKPCKVVSFVELLPFLRLHLDKYKNRQVDDLFSRAVGDVIPRENFVRILTNITGLKVLQLAVDELQLQQHSNESECQPQAVSRQHPDSMPAPGSFTQVTDSNPFGSSIPALHLLIPTSEKQYLIGQKRAFEAFGSSASKKMKVSGAFPDKNIEQLNDVIVVSGVDITEEEQQLVSASKDSSRVSEASCSVVREEEERLILRKHPLQKKLAETMAKFGLKNIDNDVYRRLSLGVEERMRGIITDLIRVSKQRVDIEKSRHCTVVTSDVREQILEINRKAREEWEKKQAEVIKLREVNEPEIDPEIKGNEEKDKNRAKSAKANKDDDDKTRTMAANAAARAAVGGGDMISKWQLMAERARQKREVGTDSVGTNAVDQDKPLSTPAATSGNNVIVPRTISVKDVIALIERGGLRISKSSLVYKVYERMKSDAAPD